MCHIDVADETVGTRHHAKGIGCVKCHGPSIDHVRDENNEVKPDRVITQKDVDKFCARCHECSRPQSARPPTAKKQGAIICTTCHGTHKVVRMPKPATTQAPKGRAARVARIPTWH
jgi:hypothetical protein